MYNHSPLPPSTFFFLFSFFLLHIPHIYSSHFYFILGKTKLVTSVTWSWGRWSWSGSGRRRRGYGPTFLSVGVSLYRSLLSGLSFSSKTVRDQTAVEDLSERIQTNVTARVLNSRVNYKCTRAHFFKWSNSPAIFTLKDKCESTGFAALLDAFAVECVCSRCLRHHWWRCQRIIVSEPKLSLSRYNLFTRVVVMSKYPFVMAFYGPIVQKLDHLSKK